LQVRFEKIAENFRNREKWKNKGGWIGENTPAELKKSTVSAKFDKLFAFEGLQ
jgi:hypothetical protein